MTIEYMQQNNGLYLEFRKTYLQLLARYTEDIENGDVQAAEEYPKLEESWKKVEAWRLKGGGTL